MEPRIYFFQKQVKDQQTVTHVAALDGEAEIRELARMLGGEEEFQLHHAVELKRTANLYKQS